METPRAQVLKKSYEFPAMNDNVSDTVELISGSLGSIGRYVELDPEKSLSEQETYVQYHLDHLDVSILYHQGIGGDHRNIVDVVSNDEKSGQIALTALLDEMRKRAPNYDVAGIEFLSDFKFKGRRYRKEN